MKVLSQQAYELPAGMGDWDTVKEQHADRQLEYLRRFTYDTIGHDDRINANLVRLVGADRVTLGSDYCFDMGLDDPLATVRRLSLKNEDFEMIAGKNAARLLHLG